MKRSFSTAMLIIGSIVGAGFASGREIISFFSTPIAPFAAVLCGLLVFSLSAAFLFVGSKIKASNFSEVNQKLAGRFNVPLDIVLLFNSFIVLAGMLAAMDSLGSIFLNIKPAFSVLSGLLAVFVVCKGIKGILKCNSVIVPLMILVLILVCGFGIYGSGDIVLPKIQGRTFWVAAVYISMNMMLAATVLSTVGEMKTRTILTASAIAGVIMTVLILMQIFALNSNLAAAYDMPILALAKSISPILYFVMLFVIAISIFTTMLTAMSGLTTWFSSLFGSRLFSSIIVLLGALALSNVGFSNVVRYLYPVIGILGIVYSVLVTGYIVRIKLLTKSFHTFFNKRNAHVHKRSKTAKNNS